MYEEFTTKNIQIEVYAFERLMQRYMNFEVYKQEDWFNSFTTLFLLRKFHRVRNNCKYRKIRIESEWTKTVASLAHELKGFKVIQVIMYLWHWNYFQLRKPFWNGQFENYNCIGVVLLSKDDHLVIEICVKVVWSSLVSEKKRFLF